MLTRKRDHSFQVFPATLHPIDACAGKQLINHTDQPTSRFPDYIYTTRTSFFP